MEHARKMVLVPEEHLSQLSAQSHKQPCFSTDASQTRPAQGIDATLTRLDTEMNEILNSNAYKDEREKWTAYLTVLQRYLHFIDDERAQQYHALMKNKPTVETSCDKEEEEETYNGMNDSVIIESVPAKFRTKAKLLLRRLRDTPQSNFSWNSAGVVSVSGKPIKDSNIVDLVNDAMRARKIPKPVGRRVFANFLRTTQTPREFIGNEALWQESRANSTLQQSQDADSGTTSEGGSETSQSAFFSGRENKSPALRANSAEQRGSGYHNKKRRVTWANLKL